MTTHSPYILTAFNNLIQAHNVFLAIKSTEKEKLADLYNLIPREQLVNFDHVSAYMISAGGAKPILDKELRLIDAGAIDNVSNVFADKFEKLLDMEASS
ncbi:hypothetical protein I5L51_08070 [Pseudomonas mendocina]|nr:hypothetical protein [Pseudomonas mendocina]MBH3339063.1 hypothetical protein [Pseudomonas mendocina]